MAVKKIKLSDVLKKHLKILAYLAGSAGVAYGISLLSKRPEAIYLAPILNYLAYAIEQELKKEGYIKALIK